MFHPHTFAFVSDAIYPYNKGGKETRLHEISTRLAAHGHHVDIYCMKWWKGSSDRIEEGVHLHAIAPHLPLYSGQRRSIRQGVFFGISCVKLLWRKFDVVDVDHMPFFPLYAVKAVCLLRGKKMVATWHEVWGKEYWNEYLGGWKGLVASWIEAWSVKCPDMILAVSELTAGRLKNELQFGGEIKLAPNGINFKEIQAAGQSKQRSDVIYAGRLLVHKHIDVLIEAIGILKKKQPGIKVFIVGEGPEKKRLEALVNKKSLRRNIVFLPFQSNVKELYGLMKASSVYVLPSTREGFGLVVLEANACGLPVVTVRHASNAAQALIRPENGVVCELKKEELAKAIKGYVNSPTPMKIDKELKKLDWDVVVSKIEAAFLTQIG